MGLQPELSSCPEGVEEPFSMGTHVGPVASPPYGEWKEGPRCRPRGDDRGPRQTREEARPNERRVRPVPASGCRRTGRSQRRLPPLRGGAKKPPQGGRGQQFFVHLSSVLSGSVRAPRPCPVSSQKVGPPVSCRLRSSGRFRPRWTHCCPGGCLPLRGQHTDPSSPSPQLHPACGGCLCGVVGSSA